MHGRRPAARAALGLAALACSLFGLTACVSIVGDKHTYAVTSSAVRVNGAQLRMQVKPEGTAGGSYLISAMVVSAAVATFDGPFSWRLMAAGKAGELESLVVHRIHTHTGKTHRDEWYPAARLGRRVEFKALSDDAAQARAVYPIPGLLVVKPRVDGNLAVTVDLTVTARGHSQRQLVRFRMDPSQKRQDEFIFLPAEIVNNFGKPLAEQDDPSWD